MDDYLEARCDAGAFLCETVHPPPPGYQPTFNQELTMPLIAVFGIVCAIMALAGLLMAIADNQECRYFGLGRYKSRAPELDRAGVPIVPGGDR